MDERKKALMDDILSTLRQTALHYGLWFAETVHALGLEAALEAEALAGDKGMDIVVARVGRSLGLDGGSAAAGKLAHLELADLEALLDSLSVSWLAFDGVWFQALERVAGMEDAKRVNDTCWSRFAAYEAASITKRYGLPRPGGLAVLKQALAHRIYSRINRYVLEDEGEGAVVLKVLECRVQRARAGKGLPDYPCKSGGLAEYRAFARTIDPDIGVECLACPPDEHPGEWFCAWRFCLV